MQKNNENMFNVSSFDNFKSFSYLCKWSMRSKIIFKGFCGLKMKINLLLRIFHYPMMAME